MSEGTSIFFLSFKGYKSMFNEVNIFGYKELSWGAIPFLKSLSLVDRDAAICLMVGLSPPIIQKETEINANSKFNREYAPKLLQDLKELQKVMAIDIPFILNGARNVYVRRNISSPEIFCFSGFTDVIFDLWSITENDFCNICDIYHRDKTILQITDIPVSDKGRMIIHKCISDWFDANKEIPIELFPKYEKVITTYFRVRYLYLNLYSELNNQGLIEKDRNIVLGLFYDFLGYIYPGRMFNEFQELNTVQLGNNKLDGFKAREHIFTAPTYWAWDYEVKVEPLEPDVDLTKYSQEELMALLDKELNLAKIESSKLEAIKHIGNKYINKVGILPYSVEEREIVSKLLDKKTLQYSEEDFKTIVNTVFKTLAQHTGKILVILGAILVASLTWWLLRGKGTEDKLQHSLDTGKRLDEDIAKTSKKKGKESALSIDEKFPPVEINAAKIAFATGHQTVLDSNIIFTKPGYTPEDILFNLSVISSKYDTIVSNLGDKNSGLLEIILKIASLNCAESSSVHNAHEYLSQLKPYVLNEFKYLPYTLHYLKNGDGGLRGGVFSPASILSDSSFKLVINPKTYTQFHNNQPLSCPFLTVLALHNGKSPTKLEVENFKIWSNMQHHEIGSEFIERVKAICVTSDNGNSSGIEKLIKRCNDTHTESGKTASTLNDIPNSMNRFIGNTRPEEPNLLPYFHAKVWPTIDMDDRSATGQKISLGYSYTVALNHGELFSMYNGSIFVLKGLLTDITEVQKRRDSILNNYRSIVDKENDRKKKYAEYLKNFGEE